MDKGLQTRPEGGSVELHARFGQPIPIAFARGSLLASGRDQEEADGGRGSQDATRHAAVAGRQDRWQGQAVDNQDTPSSGVGTPRTTPVARALLGRAETRS